MNNLNKDILLIKETFQAYLNVIDMLKERGYEVIDNEILSIDIFSKKYEESDEFMYIFDHKINKSKIYFSIFKESKITKKDLINKIKIIVEENQYDNYLFLTSDSQTLNHINEVNNIFNMDIQLFVIDKLQINILKHVLQPDEIILYNNEDTAKLLKDRKWKEEELPKINLKDAVSRYFNAKSGQIFKFIRTSMVDVNSTSSQGIYYRIVVE
jgi:DNA-directed RNA polymerase subunit H (RpoH/RPB5)|tara:strand:- start:1250 stop:1885 length:636 start_codon:yes stop_codon:yes gene_type:complete